MTREELKEHCEKQMRQFERIKEIIPITLNDQKRYEEHKLILEILKQESFINKPETVTEFADRCRECGKQKTGHWILADVEYNRVYHCNCSECGKDPMDYIRGSENWWLIKNRLPKCCPNCGVKMIESQENDCDNKARDMLSKLCGK